MKKTTAALANPRGGWLRAGESSRARAPARPRDSRGPAGRAPSRVHPATWRAPRPRSRRTRSRGAPDRAGRPIVPEHFLHTHTLTLSAPASRHPQPYKFNATKDSAAEAANVSDRPRESSPAERIHHSSRSPEVRARAFASRGAARGAARDAGGEGPKKTSGPTDRACSHLEIFPTPARGIRVARGVNDAETPAGPHAEPKTDPSVPSIAKQSDQPTIGGGYNLLKRIRRVYAHDERPYHAFLAILIRFRNAEFTTEQVRAPASFRRRKPRKRPRSNRPGVFSIVDGIREAASVARDRSRRPFPATRQPAPRGN